MNSSSDDNDGVIDMGRLDGMAINDTRYECGQSEVLFESGYNNQGLWDERNKMVAVSK